MRRLFRIFNILIWPMWLKLSVAFLVAIALPVVLVLLVLRSSYFAVNTQNLLDDLKTHGERQAAAISEALTQSQATLATFTSTPDYNRQMTRLLEPDGNTPTNIRQMSLTLQSLLIGSESFNHLRLLNKDGLIMVDVTVGQILATGESAADTPAFQQATAAQVQNRDQTISVYNPDDPAIDLTNAVHNSLGTVVGFLVGSLDVDHTIVRNMSYEEVNFPVYSYLITFGQTPVLITEPNTLEEAQNSVNNRSVGIERAFRGGTDSDTYTIGTSHKLEVAAYYAPISNPSNPAAILFALILEVPSDQALPGATTQYLNQGQPFVIGIGVIGLLIILVILFNQMITPPLSRLRQAIQAITGGNFDMPVTSAGRGDEIGDLSASFVDMRTHVRNLLDDLQGRVAARTRDINATHEIGRFAATQRDLQILMDQVVQLIIEQFPNIYHAQIFLLDQDRNYAVLRASTGEAGKALLARGHRLAAGSVSLVGQAVEQGRTVIARDTTASQVWRPNELLPDTRAELSIPLKVGEIVIGTLDVQSRYSNAFTEEEINILQTMADQIAVAIENARLYQESVRRLEEIERTNRQATLQTWQEYVYGQRQRQITSHAGVSTGNDLSELRRRAIAQGKVVMGERTDHNTIPVAVPILLRGQTLGAVEWELPVSDINDNKLQLAQDLANRLAVSLDNARLFQESQRAAERERIVNSIAAKLTPQTEISEILQTAVREVGQALRAPQVSIRLHRSDQPSSNGNGNGSSTSVDYQNGNSKSIHND